MNLGLYKGLLLLLLSFLSIFNESFADPPLPTPIGRVVWVKGTFKAIMQNKEERILQKMSLIYLHDLLITDATSEAQIVFTDESLMTFYPNTHYSVDLYEFAQSKKTSFGGYIGHLIEGGFRTITGLIAKNHPNNYQVNTPVATIGVRGTDFSVYYKDGKVYLARYSGTPCVRGTKNAQKQELCCSPLIPYAYVPGEGQAPVGLTQQPAVFNEKLNVVPFKISPFVAPGGGREGVITSFCISQ